MRFKRQSYQGPGLTLETDSDTVIRREAYAEHVVAIASRYGSSTKRSYPILSIGDGFAFDEAIEAAFAAYLERQEAKGFDVEQRYAVGPNDETEPSYVFHINGCPYSFDIDHDVMIVTLVSK